MAWEQAQSPIVKAQHKQKQKHNKSAKNWAFRLGERVLYCMSAMKAGHNHKLACPYEGPYRIITLYPNGADVHLIANPRAKLRVAFNRLPEEMLVPSEGVGGCSAVPEEDPAEAIERISSTAPDELPDVKGREQRIPVVNDNETRPSGDAHANDCQKGEHNLDWTTVPQEGPARG